MDIGVFKFNDVYRVRKTLSSDELAFGEDAQRQHLLCYTGHLKTVLQRIGESPDEP